MTINSREVVETDHILVAVETAKARGFSRESIISAISSLGAAKAPDTLPIILGAIYSLRDVAGMAPSVPYAKADAQACLSVVLEIKEFMHRRKQQEQANDADVVGIYDRLDRTFSAVGLPKPPKAPPGALLTDCLNFANVLEKELPRRFEDLEAGRRRAELALEDARADNLEQATSLGMLQQVLADQNAILKNSEEKIADLEHQLLHERTGNDALSEMIAERDRAIVALVLNDLGLVK